LLAFLSLRGPPWRAPITGGTVATKNFGVRFTEELAEQIDARGGGPWIKQQIISILDASTLTLEQQMLKALEELGPEGSIPVTEPLAAPDPQGPAPEAPPLPAPPAEALVEPPLAGPAVPVKPQSAAGPVSLCPRWMHHRKGVFCKACETVQ
jgi:hypothetical protein